MHDEIAESEEADIRPSALVGGHITGVWDDLDKNNERYTVEEIIREKDHALLKEELSVSLKSQLKGKLVHLEGPTRESIDTACERLRGLLIFKVSIQTRTKSQEEQQLIITETSSLFGPDKPCCLRRESR